MMEIEEAIKILKSCEAEIDQVYDNRYVMPCPQEILDCGEAIKMAIFLMEKNVAKNVINIHKSLYLIDTFIGECPCCESTVSTENGCKETFCPRCGQAILWEDENGE